MNAQRHLFRMGLLISLASLAGCGANAESAVATSTSIERPVDQPISVRTPLEAPKGWSIHGSAMPSSRLTTYHGKLITELSPVEVKRASL